MLSQTLLKKDFQLDVEIPAGKLVPTLPNRMNYLLWLEDIVNALQLPEEETITGLDVGRSHSHRREYSVASERDAG